jgi:hypothetical protein
MGTHLVVRDGECTVEFLGVEIDLLQVREHAATHNPVPPAARSALSQVIGASSPYLARDTFGGHIPREELPRAHGIVREERPVDFHFGLGAKLLSQQLLRVLHEKDFALHSGEKVAKSLREGISGGNRSRGRFRSRFPSTEPEPTCTRRPRKFGICPSFKGHFLSPCAEP